MIWISPGSYPKSVNLEPVYLGEVEAENRRNIAASIYDFVKKPTMLHLNVFDGLILHSRKIIRR